MAFRFKRKEDFATGFARIAHQQIERAEREWKNANRTIAVHETRKSVKRLRALLQLVRPVLRSNDYRGENAFLRDIARSLSTPRDETVMVETIDFLNEESTPEEQRLLNVLRAQLAEVVADGPSGARPSEQKIAKEIRQAGKRLAALNVTTTGLELVASGFERTYRQGRRQMSVLIAAHTDEASHEWRKRVQAHWRQLRLLSAAWPDFFETRIALARHLSDSLGRDHDLAMLGEYANGPAANTLGSEGVTAISELINKRQQELRSDSLGDGRVLFADPPKVLLKQIRRYWEIAAGQPKTFAVSRHESRDGWKVRPKVEAAAESHKSGKK